MAEQDEAIKVVVEVVDKFSKPLNDLKKELDRISDRGGDGATKVKKHFDGLREAATNVGNALNATVVPALRAVGIGFGGLAATIATAVTALKGFAGTTEVLSRLSRETGISIDRMRELEAVGRRLGISAGEMRSGFRDFAASMHQTRLGIGDAAKDLRMHGQGEFAEQLRRTKTNAEALELILKKLDTISDPQNRRDFLKGQHLPPGLADANRKEREKLIKEWRDSVGATTKEDTDAADRFEHSLWRMGNAFESLTQKMTTEGSLDTLTKSLTSISDLVPELIKGINQFNESYGKFQKFMTPPQLPTASWEEWWENFKQRFGGGGGNNTAPAAPADPKKMSYGGGTFGGAQVIRASLVGGGDEEKTKETIAEGVVEGLKKWALDQGAEGPGAHGGQGGQGGNGAGGAPVIRASLGGSPSSRGGNTGGGGDGGGGPQSAGGGSAPDQSDRPYKIGGKVTVGGQEFTWGSGGAKRGSLPYGDFPVNIGDPQMGPWGRTHGAIATIGGAGGVIDDPKYPGRPRAGIEIHPGSGATLDRLYSEGCFAVPRQQWPAFKRALLEQAKNGPLMLHVGRNGRAEILSRQDWRARYGGGATAGVPLPRARPDAPRPPAVPRDRMMDASARQSQVAKIEGAASVRIDLAGYGRAPAHNSSPSAGVFSEVQLHRGSTIPFASESA
jgi:hypothetical protein